MPAPDMPADIDALTDAALQRGYYLLTGSTTTARTWSLMDASDPARVVRLADEAAVRGWVKRGNMLTIHHGDNLDYLRAAVKRGDRFDLVEFDGPYGAGLEGWDILTEAEYVAHYAERLTLVRQVLQPWGVVEMFGYPEMVAMVRAWAAETGALHLRRWITWYKQVTAHKGRKVETVALFTLDDIRTDVLIEFGAMLKAERVKRGMSLRDVGIAVGREWLHRGGTYYHETGSGGKPTIVLYQKLKALFEFGDEWDRVVDFSAMFFNYGDLTDLDYIGRHYSEDTRNLNDAGLRSKPVGLYLDLFRPVIPPRDDRCALILYGGSGNAAIAAGRLGYAVTVCETDSARCDLIRRRYAWGVERRDETPVEELGPLFNLPKEAA